MPLLQHHSLFAVSTGLPSVSTVGPLKVEVFARELKHHPDRERVAFILNGLQEGFRLGFDNSRPLKSAKCNKPTAYKHSGVIDAYLANEVQLGRVAGPFSSPPIPSLHISSFSVIPKKGQPGKWRLIVDLSSPHDHSVNDGIDADNYSMHYVRVDEIIRMVAKHGMGALMAKFDVEAAYRNVPIHPKDRYLLGLKWRGQFYVDLALPFGLRSAPFIFNGVADMVEWILINNYELEDLVHYLDDFILAGPPDTLRCHRDLTTALNVCKQLGLPLHPKKCEGPATSLTILGIRLDSVRQTAELPPDKFAALKSLIHSWTSKQWCTKKELQSLIGHLHHAAKVVWPGRAFIRRMLDLLHCFRRNDHPIRLNREFRLDLSWWHQFLSEWHGVSFWLFPGLSPPPDTEVMSDASGAVGFGAIWGEEWFNGIWLHQQVNLSIAYKELYPIVMAAALWGSHWSRQHIMFRSDNEAVVLILNSRTSKVPVIMHLVRHLLLSAARFQFSFSTLHIPGLCNVVADALSRFNWQAFRQLAPRAAASPIKIPRDLVEDLTSNL